MRELYFEKEISENLKNVLNELLNNNTRITLDYGNIKTGKSWNETLDITGTISRTTGIKQIPILLYNKKSIGGCAILTNCILSIKYSNKKDGQFLYKL